MRKVYGGKMSQTFSINFTSASHDIIKWIEVLSNNKFFSKNGGFRKMRTTQGVNPYYHISIAGQAAVQMFIFLSQYDVPILDRKWRDERILQYIKQEYSIRPENYTNFLWNTNSFIYQYFTK